MELFFIAHHHINQETDMELFFIVYTAVLLIFVAFWVSNLPRR